MKPSTEPFPVFPPPSGVAQAVSLSTRFRLLNRCLFLLLLFLTASAGHAAELRLNRLIYAAGNEVSAQVTVANPDLLKKEYLWVILASPDSKDAERVPLVPTNFPGIYVTADRVLIALLQAGQDPQLDDDVLHVRPGEMIVSLFYSQEGNLLEGEKPTNEPQGVADFAVIEDPNFADSPVKVTPQVAMTDDEQQFPAGGKPVGTVVPEGGLPVQFPINELILYPRSQRQLEEFLQLTGGKVLQSDGRPNQNEPTRSYLIQVDPGKADVAHLSQMRSLFGEKETLHASRPEALQIYALAMQFRLEGYVVGVNPRLQWMGPNSTRDDPGSGPMDVFSPASPPNIPALADDRFGVRRAWAYLALWDQDTQRVPMGILDMGFAPNWDFRGFPSDIFQRSLEEGTVGPGTAVAPPTVGNSFFGARSWHGNGVVTTAAGVLNNGWGTAGTGGQVVTPMLYKTGLRSYAFEMGHGMRLATDDGAAIINISAGYPCRIISNVGVDFDICSPAGRAALCTLVTAALSTAAITICAATGWIPVAGAIACGAAVTAAATASTACFATLLIGDPRGPLQDGVNYARSRGVTVVSIAGNQQTRESLGSICDFIQCGRQDAGNWQVVPGVLPGVICVGAADDRPPYANNQYWGARVDIWAPVFTSFFRPPTTDAVTGPDAQTRQNDFSGTSAAAPYIAGIIAMMEAANPSLNPRNPALTPAQRAAIPDRIRNLLVETATPASLLPNDPANPDVARRRNMVNAIAAVERAATLAGMASIPNFAALYETDLNFREYSPATTLDTTANSHLVSWDWSGELGGTILFLPRYGPPGGTDYTDVDWFSWTTPPTTGVYSGGRVRMTLPQRSRWGTVLLNDQHGTLLSRSSDTTTEIWEYQIPPQFHSSRFHMKVSGVGSSDNAYKLRFVPGRFTPGVPEGDRFDRSALNPPSRPNNDVSGRAVPLGEGGEIPWAPPEGPRPTDLIFGSSSIEIMLRDLNFHRPGDEDWFSLNVPGGGPAGCSGGCTPNLSLFTGPGVTLSVYGSDGRLIKRSDRSPVMLVCNEYVGRFPLRIQATSTTGGPVAYHLRFVWTTPSDEICRRANEANQLNQIRYIGRLLGSRVVDFPIIDPLDDPVPYDNFGRITRPEAWGLVWRGGDQFRLLAQVRQGESLALQLTDIKGTVLAQAVTPDLLSVFPNAKTAPVAEGLTDVMLEFPQALPEGGYLLLISHAKPKTKVDLTLPRNAISDGSVALEDRFLPFFVPGDVSGDLELDVVDVIAVLQHIVGAKPMHESLIVIADADGSGKLDVVDVIYMLQHITGLRDLYQSWGGPLRTETLSSVPEAPTEVIP